MEAFLKGKAGTSGTKLTKDKSKAAKEGTSESSAKQKGPVPWVEKYRPKTVDDVAYQEEVVAVLKKTLQGGDLPNLLFYGPPGTGKTSTILALSRELFGDMFHARILELNASDERGIQVVREKVKTFAKQTASGVRPDGRPCPPFKIVILDEADSMTSSAQAALRRTMETETRSTRFCLICNYVSRIIEPLTSRCSKFRFKPLTKEITTERLKHISKEEGVQIEDSVLEALVDTCEGDLRRAITLLQSAFRLKGNENIMLEDIQEIACVIPEKWIDGLFEVCKSSSYEKMQEYITDMVAEGFTAGQLIVQLSDKIIFHPDLNDKQKSAICKRLAVAEHRLMDGADEYLQMLDICSELLDQLCHGI